MSWTGCALDFSEDPDNGQEQSHPSLSGSGYNSVRVVWEDESEDTLSPWEVALKDAMPPRRPSLTDDEKRTIRRALKTINSLPNIDAFRSPVDESHYSDYRTRVEVPMDLTFITTRLEADYYSTKYSVVADVRLVQTNCAKYNGDHDDLTELAGHLIATFEDNVFSEEEKLFFHEYDLPISGLPLDALGDGENGGRELRSAPVVIQRRTARQRGPPRSVLEDIAGSSPEEAIASRVTRAGRTVRLDGSREQRTESSILEVAARHVAPTLEQLSSNNFARGRTTRTRHNNQRAASHTRNIPQRSTRAGSGNAANRDPSWNAMGETVQRSDGPDNRPFGTGDHGNSATHHSLRPGLRNSQSRDSSPSDEELHPLEDRRFSRAASSSAGQGDARRPRIRIRSSRRAPTADDEDFDGSQDHDMGQVAARGSSRRSTRNSAAVGFVPEASLRSRSRKTRAGTKRPRDSSDEASSAEEPGADESDFGEDFDGKGHSSGSESEISEAFGNRNGTVSTRISRAQTRRSRAVKAEDGSVGSAQLGRKKAPQNRRTEAIDSYVCHARSTRHSRKSYVDPSESEFGSDVDSPESCTQPLKPRKGNNDSKKRRGLFAPTRSDYFWDGVLL